MYYVYLLKSSTTGRHYIGQTNNLERRISEHNKGKHPSTRNRGPWQLINSVNCSTRSEAIQLERKLKAMKRPDRVSKYLEKLV